MGDFHVGRLSSQHVDRADYAKTGSMDRDQRSSAVKKLVIPKTNFQQMSSLRWLQLKGNKEVIRKKEFFR